MNRFLILIVFICFQSYGQKIRKADRAIIENLKETVQVLASDEMEGRRTGTPGEKKAYEYLMKQLEASDIAPRGEKDTYLQTFEIDEGKMILDNTSFSVNGKKLSLHEDFYPLVFSPAETVSGTASPSIKEGGVPWFLDVTELLESQTDNPHFDIYQSIKEKAREFKEKGATALILLNSANYDGLAFNKSYEGEQAAIPVIVVNKPAATELFGEAILDYALRLQVAIGDKKRSGTNVIGYIDNGAASTVVLGAHYDHLGWGEDKNSLHTGDPQIHNGADDNASGVAAVLELGRMLKKSKLRNQNYLLLFFSGEELGLFGSKYFTKHPTVPLEKVNYMINLDMIGRLNEENTLTIGGYGTSPAWSSLLEPKTKALTASFDSSGVGPSDHTSFYLQNIPVLFFFTGSHKDYHKPSDDTEKINYKGQLFIIKYIYDIIEKTNSAAKLTFAKTREPQMKSARFSVSLGIMPDYTFTGKGVHVDGVTDGRPAQIAGIQTGDIVLKIGDYETPDLEAYMLALSKFKKGDAAAVTVKRGGEEKVFQITF